MVQSISKKSWSHLALLLLIIMSLKAHHTTASDTIFPGQSLSWNQTLISRNGIFELGFFTPAGMSHKYYLGIWYKRLTSIEEKTVVWVANRECPLNDPSSKALEFYKDDNLIITEKGIPFCIGTNSSMPNPTVAVLLDNGNFILRDNLDNVLWQSFEEQTNTWLPGAKIRYNRHTNRSNILVSWRNYESPDSGQYYVELKVEENGTAYLVLYNGKTRIVSNEELNNPYINASYVSNNNESYFIYSAISPSTFTRFVLEVTGTLSFFVWDKDLRQWNLVRNWMVPSALCEIDSFCGDFGICDQTKKPPCDCLNGFKPKYPGSGDNSGGCERRNPLQCSDGGIDEFLVMPNMRFPEASKHPPKVNNVEECKLQCLIDCYCTAYAYKSGCLIYQGGLTNLRLVYSHNEFGGDLHVRISTSELVGSRARIFRKVAWIVGFLVALILSIGLAITWRRHSGVGALQEVEFSLILFNYRDLRIVTKNFSQKLGEGGFGSVFKGILPNSTAIAVKKIRSLEQGEKQFRAEVSTLGAIQHVNILRLRGFCVEASKRFLVYEHMPKGSLESHLFQTVSIILAWKTRYRIAIGTARGLAYLHENCRDCIIHCDIKPENILLDADYDPKVADFGLAKVIGRDFSRVLTTMRGTRGYLAPEWISGEAVTPKVDVFSYGKLLFEILSGRRNVNMLDDEICNYFPARVAIAMNKGEDLRTFLDFQLEGRANMEELTRACKVACWCIQDDPKDRPTMGQVVKILEGVMQVGIPQIPLYFQRLSENPTEMIVYHETGTSSSSY
uniref:Receptor-like serine/threonine-protein kinase n=1 Tax=Fagus sylvatica TaxID=28930 RepID=A0A2N9EYX2_FAGSY